MAINKFNGFSNPFNSEPKRATKCRYPLGIINEFQQQNGTLNSIGNNKNDNKENQQKN